MNQQDKDRLRELADAADEWDASTYRAFYEFASPAAILSLLEENEALERDAARYRWLRSQPNDCSAPRIDICHWTCDEGDSVNNGEGIRDEKADSMIDAAMQHKGD